MTGYSRIYGEGTTEDTEDTENTENTFRGRAV
jgi:hypothetical protein